jgi:hypothetical protein
MVRRGCGVPHPTPGGTGTWLPRLPGAMLVLLSAVAVGTASCGISAAPVQRAYVRLVAQTRAPASATSVLAGTPDVLAAGLARDLFADAPVVVVASANRPADLAAAASRAEQAHAPLLLTWSRAVPAAASAPARGAGASMAARTAAGTAAAQTGGTAALVSAALQAEIHALQPRAVLAVGVPGKVLSAQLPGIHVVTDPAMLPAASAPAPLGHVVVLARKGGSAAVATAAEATAQAAGAQVIAVRSNDPRADPAAIAALAAARPRQVIAVGAGFGPATRLASRVAVAVTGVQLPGGGQIVFPIHRLVALYGHPGAPGLGALGQQGLRASIARARKAAALYRALSSVPVVPAFEIIATVAQGAGNPGPDGSYSYESPVASLRPWVKAATAAGMYVILDLQPGRANLLTQAKMYEPLLKGPNVGLALDPEWKLQPGQLPLHQIGSVNITEVNGVVNWLASLTARYHLPQKVLVLHQFRLSMIENERRLDTHHDDLSIVIHMDGQGTASDKEQTWEAVIKAAPAGVSFGWKNFYTKDHPMLTPGETMARTPKPMMISYQ